MRFHLSLIAAAGLVVLGCGYHLVETSRSSGPDLERLEVRPLENHSNEPLLERMISDALVEEFARRGVFRPVYAAGPDGSGLYLTGAIRDLSITPSAFSSVSIALEHRIELEVELDLLSPGTNTPVWQSNRMILRERFLGSADPGVHDSNKEQALRRMASELAGRVHDALLQKF